MQEMKWLGSQRLKEIVRQKEQARQEAVDRANEMTARVNDALKILSEVETPGDWTVTQLNNWVDRLKITLANDLTVRG